MGADTYTTIQGDTWDSIAKALWAEERLMHLLLSENPDYLGVTVFSGGVTLKVPAVSDEDLAQADLPPWKQGVTLG